MIGALVSGAAWTEDHIRPARILVVDDDAELRRFLATVLRANGYNVDTADGEQRGLQSLGARGADLVVLDLTLPDGDGQALLRAVRQWSQVPVIVLSGRAEETEKVSALDAGANDYITKPFGVHELLARVRAQLRGPSTVPERATLDDGYLRIDLAERTVTLGGDAVTLTRKEYALLAMLARNVGRVVTQSQLLRELWGPTYEQDTHYLRILVGKLRQKLGDDAASPRWILTEPGVGLRLLLAP
ncbi:DNA-binding response regulator [Lysobacter helvus]|uniref:DNA-binding response regulator n=2 Tax=Lysobacteraceae TaxID=32033 RepID=A0ABM7Q799_9GAMM|nr:DNA-binding response regulator [Lysobacter caseinilyticus]BCT96398.1 DNA-binding response regulator [Lysobacter helvus]